MFGICVMGFSFGGSTVMWLDNVAGFPPIPPWLMILGFMESTRTLLFIMLISIGRHMSVYPFPGGFIE